MNFLQRDHIKANLHQVSIKGKAKFQKIDVDLATADSQFNCHCWDINDQEKGIHSLHKRQEQLEEQISGLMRLVNHLGIEVNVYDNVYDNAINKLKAKVMDMEDYLCHCVDQGKGKGKEVVQVEKESLVFNYDSDDAYYTAPSTGRVKALKLIPIDSDPEGREVKKTEGYKSCRCG